MKFLQHRRIERLERQADASDALSVPRAFDLRNLTTPELIEMERILTTCDEQPSEQERCAVERIMRTADARAGIPRVRRSEAQR